MHEAQRVWGRGREGGSERESASGAVALAHGKKKSFSNSVAAGILTINCVHIVEAPLAPTT